ncbi:small archaeal modifier protein 2 [Salinirussus salinus]|uniref:small archaeal modifier protein 2 n=1 Tax=Salinirussus salinus TaxID=1198300 RepID=UPI00135BA2B6|nr:small archaeal modifier protein 2 [Salinirussus salinus]
MPTVAVDFAGEGVREVEGETYADLLAPFEVSRQEVAVLVDGNPVPTDVAVPEDVDTVQVVRLVEGG